MWPFRKKPVEPPYRWSVEARLEEQVFHAIHREKHPDLGAYLSAMQNVAQRARSAQELGAMANAQAAAGWGMQAAPLCSVCHQALTPAHAQIHATRIVMPDPRTAPWATLVN